MVVSLLKEGYAGSASVMRMADEPIEEQASTSDADELVPLRPRKGAVRLHASQGHVVEDVYADDTPWRIRIEVDGQLDVVGPIRKHLRTTSDDLFSTSALKLKWNDGLGHLQNTDFVQSGGTPYEERRSVIGWITEILRKTGLGLEVAAASEWYAYHMGTSRSPLEQEVLGPGRFTDEDGRPLTCFEVLEDLVGGKGGFLCQERGRWHFYQRALYRKGSFDRHVYPNGWTDGDASPPAQTFDATVQVSDDYKDRLKGGERPSRQAYPSVQVTYEHRTIGNMLPAWLKYGEQAEDAQRPDVDRLIWDIPRLRDSPGFFEVAAPGEYGAGFPGGRQYRGWLSPPVRDNDDAKTVGEILQYRARSPATYTNQPLQLSFAAHIQSFGADPSYEMLGYCKVILQGQDGTTYYLRRNVVEGSDGYSYEGLSWSTDSSSFVAVVLDPGREIKVELTSPDLPAEGSARVEMYGAIEPQASEASLYYKINHPTLVPTGVDGQRSKTLSVCTAAAEDAGEEKEVSVMHGTGPTGSHPSATYQGTDPTAKPVEDWKVSPYGSDESPSGHTASELLAREMVYQLASKRTTLRRTPLGSAPSLIRALELPSGERYLPVHARTDYKRGFREVEAVRVLYESGLDVSFSTRTSEGSGGGGSSGDGSPGSSGGGSAAWPVSHQSWTRCQPISVRISLRWTGWFCMSQSRTSPSTAETRSRIFSWTVLKISQLDWF